MQLTNELELPSAIVEAVKNDPYDPGDSDITATSLIDPPQIVELKRLYGDQLVEDASDRLWSLMGQIAHGILERAEVSALTEKRLYAEMSGWKIGGQFDRMVLLPDGLLQDYKLSCLPLDTEVLTRNGFRPIGEIIIGEEVLGYNAERDCTEWTHVRNVLEPRRDRVWRIQNSRFNVRCTPNHRWAVRSISAHQDDDGNSYKTSHIQYKQTQDLKSSDNIICAASLMDNRDDYIHISSDEAALIGWIFTDGYGGWKGDSPSFQLSQKKLAGREEIERRFTDFISGWRERSDGVVIYNLRADMIRGLFNAAGIRDKDDLPRLVTRLNKRNRQEMINAMQMAEGQVKFAQNYGPVLDAYLILLSLEGIAHGLSHHPTGTAYISALKSREVWHSGMHALDDGEQEYVTCLQTGTGSFVIRQNGRVTITGNSVWEWIFGLKPERVQQLNVLAWLARQNGYTVNDLEIVMIFRDWTIGKSQREQNYPPRQVARIPVPLWDEEQVQNFIHKRLLDHQEARKGNIRECTDDERWAKSDKWAVMKQGRQSAVRVFGTEKEARVYMERSKDAAKMYIEHRPGENVRCENYCPVGGPNGICEQYKRLKGEA